MVQRISYIIREESSNTFCSYLENKAAFREKWMFLFLYPVKIINQGSVNAYLINDPFLFNTLHTYHRLDFLNFLIQKFPDRSLLLSLLFFFSSSLVQKKRQSCISITCIYD